MPSVICFNLDHSKVLSSGNEFRLDSSHYAALIESIDTTWFLILNHHQNFYPTAVNLVSW